MMCISLWQPWASAIALGIKSYETRSWTTSYRGLLAIHAAQTDSPQGRQFYQTEMTLGRLPKGGLPVGSIICVVDLVDIITTMEAELLLSPIEKLYGDYRIGRYAWKLTNVRVLAKPIPYRGRQRLYEVKLKLDGLAFTCTKT